MVFLEFRRKSGGFPFQVTKELQWNFTDPAEFRSDGMIFKNGIFKQNKGKKKTFRFPAGIPVSKLHHKRNSGN